MAQEMDKQQQRVTKDKGKALEDKEKVCGERSKESEAPGTEKQKEYDDMEAYRCFILEEPPPQDDA